MIERNFTQILERIMREIPVENVELLQRFHWLRNDAAYKAPEAMIDCWKGLAFILNAYCFPERSAWEEKIRAIFANEIEGAK